MSLHDEYANESNNFLMLLPSALLPIAPQHI